MENLAKIHGKQDQRSTARLADTQFQLELSGKAGRGMINEN